MKSIKTKLGFDGMLAVSCNGRRGGLALLWREGVTVDTQTYSPNHIDVAVHTQSSPIWRLTGIYGHPEEERKLDTWRLMRHLHARASLPWVCLGDFNELLASNEKNGGNMRSLAPMAEFRHTLLHYGLVDMGFSGYRFTWRNRRPGAAFVEERLDRAVATSEWCEIFPRAKVSHLSVSYSDHDPIMLDTAPPTQSRRRRQKIQRFEEKWATHTDCERIIQESWN
ncbi:hypothetical protein SO802_020403 [Lithocarpus litseifolius]|uniref:Endonuclease/exonuclease/phosphatase domain-containing protein n=1 Tax=Lithocarpus litseifolius TaxID=425828 RepID=A0AAW2CED2_9ROSI